MKISILNNVNGFLSRDRIGKIVRAVLAVLLPFLSFFIQITFWKFIKPFVWFLFYPAVFISSWIGGFYSGIAATGISIALVLLFFVPPEGVHILPVAVFFIMGVMFSKFHDRLRKASLDLRRNEDLLQRVLAALPVGVWMVDKSGRITEGNPAGQRIWAGARYVDLDQYGEYKGWWYKTGKELKSEEWAAARAITKGETSIDEEIEIECFDGTHKIILNSAMPIIDESKNVLGAIIVNQDITERVHTAEALRKYADEIEDLYNNAPCGYHSLDKDGVFVRINNTELSWLGYSREEVVGKMRLSDIITSSGMETLKVNFPLVKKRGWVRDLEFDFVRKDGTVLPVMASATAVKDKEGNFLMSRSTVFDITELKKAEKKLEESRKSLRTLIDSLPLWISFFDLRGRYIVANRRYSESFGRPIEEIEGVDFREVLPLSILKIHGPYVDKCLAGEVVNFSEVVDIGGKEIHSEGVYTPLFGDDGGVYGGCVYVMDVSKRKEIEEALKVSEANLKRAQEVAHIGSWYLDLLKNELYWSDEEYRMFKIPMGTPMTYEKFLETIHPEDRELVNKTWAAALNRVPYDIEHRILVDDKIRWVRERAEVEFDSDERAVSGTGTTQDITEIKKAEEEMKKAKASAEEANRAKSEFLANMSHDIRTPMNARIGMSELLSETSMTEEQLKYVEIFRRAGENLLSLINDILDLSKVESGRLELEDIDFDLNEMIEKAVEIFGLKAHEKGLELSYYIKPDVPLFIKGDPGRLRQIIVNLIGNAIKFTDKGEVVLEVGSYGNMPLRNHDDEEIEILFSVRDTGTGIASDKLDTIFESFSQAHASTSRIYGGTGLGLAIAKKIVEMMGGKIWVESRVGEGSTFFFTSRFGVSASPPIRETPVANLEGVRVLVVDDNATNRLILRETVGRLGAKVTDVESGEKAVSELKKARAEENPFKIMLLDKRMPKMDGFQVVEEVQKDHAIADTTIMMLTSESSREDMRRSREAGVDAYLIKPIKRTELLSAISAAIRKEETLEKIPAKKELVAEKHRPLNILLVEDSEDNRLLIQTYLRESPHGIETAGNGEMAVSKFKEAKYDLVLMDMQMPIMDGYAATREIRKWEKETGRQATPIVALTAYALKEDAEKSLEAGCTSHISKPVKKARLLEVISKYANKGGS